MKKYLTKSPQLFIIPVSILFSQCALHPVIKKQFENKKIETQELNTTKALVEHKTDVSMSDDDNIAPLKLDIPPHNQNLVENGATVIYFPPCGIYFLHSAARDIKLELVRKLIADGEKVNEKDASGNTPLHLVLTNFHPAEWMCNGEGSEFDRALQDIYLIIEELLKAGADLTIKNKYDKTALQIVEASKKAALELGQTTYLLMEKGFKKIISLLSKK